MELHYPEKVKNLKKVHFSITVAMTILLVILMILSALVIALPGMQGREYGMSPAATSSANIQPDPTLNTNVTWEQFNSSWAELEYYNGSAHENLTAQPSSLYANPISIKVASIQPKTLNGTYAGMNFFNPSNYILRGSRSSTPTVANSSTSIYLKGNASSTIALQTSATVQVPWAQMPSQNTNYDYITATLTLSDNAGATTYAALTIGNQTAAGAFVKEVYSTLHATAGKTIYLSESIAQLISGSGMQVNSTTNSYIYIGFYLYQAAGTAADTPIANLSMSNFAITTYPISLGRNSTGAAITEANNQANLSTFNPSTHMLIENNGYSVAVQQTMQNLTTQQSAINTLNYIEQVEYQGQFELPTAPDLSYGSANITERFNVSTAQTQVLDINGVSYLSTISGKNNTIQLLSSVNPNSQTEFLQIVDYTQSQWTSISSPPGIFTLAGIEYYWEEFIIAVLAIVGVGAGAASRHAANLRRGK